MATAKHAAKASGDGTKAKPWKLKTPLRAIDDLHAMLKAHGDWMPLGGADEQKPAADVTVEAWGTTA